VLIWQRNVLNAIIVSSVLVSVPDSLPNGDCESDTQQFAVWGVSEAWIWIR